MTRGAYDLPPLDALVAFESAARHLSFTRAADGDAVGLNGQVDERLLDAVITRVLAGMK